MGTNFFSILIASFIFSFIAPLHVLATDTPTQSSPANNTSVTNNTLSWQSLSSATSYRVQVDDQADLASPSKDYNTTNTSYSPTLENNTWYWRVKAKDDTGTWGDWSDIWYFTLTTATPSPTPSATPTPSSTPTPSPSQSSTPSPTPSPTNPPVGDATTEKFLISNIPSTIHHDQTFTATVQLQNLLPNSKYYLKGAFVKDGSTNYFGLTQVKGNWVINGANYSTQYDLNTDSSGNWSGNLRVQPDATDTGFTGIGTYSFKVARYNSSGSGLTWSAITNVTIDTAPSPAASPSPSTSSNANPDSTLAPTLTNSRLSVGGTVPTSSDSTIQLPNLESSQTATVAGIQLANPANKSTSPIVDSYWYIIGGVGLLLLGASPTLYIHLKPRITDAIHHFQSRWNQKNSR